MFEGPEDGAYVLDPTEDGLLRSSRPAGWPEIEVGTVLTVRIEDDFYTLRAVKVEADSVSWVSV